VFRRLPKLLMTVALACSIGLHWSLLQSIAWTTMLVTNLSKASFSQAIQRTFDGRQPCCLCNAIAAGKKSERKSETVVPLKKFEALTPPLSICLIPSAFYPAVPRLDWAVPTLPHAPPTPPPRAA